jgi:DNA-binding response OmpR family regulator
MPYNEKPIVLIIDDDKDYLEILRLGLSNEFEILTIGNFQGLEKTLEGMRPSIILLDKNLGETQPKDVIATIRKFEPMRDIPILLMSGSDPGRRDSSDDELEGFMIKPTSFQEVRDRLRSTLNRK